MIEQQDGERGEEKHLASELPAREGPKRYARDDRTDDGQRPGLDDRIGKHSGPCEIIKHRLSVRQSMMPKRVSGFRSTSFLPLEF